MRNFFTILCSLAVFLTACAKTTIPATMESEPTTNPFTEAGYESDSFTTNSGRSVNLVFIKHGSIAIDIDGYIVYIDPVTIFGNNLSILPKADMILITHEHHDHLDPKAIELLSSDSTIIFASQRVSESLQKATPVAVGEEIKSPESDFVVKTMPAYNISPDHLQFHPQQRGDLGFIFDIDGLKIYVAGDTEDIPEMARLRDQNIDIAFIPVNQPYTMTPMQAINAIEMIQPRVLYPYHFGQTDLSPIVNHFAPGKSDTTSRPTEIRIRSLQ